MCVHRYIRTYVCMYAQSKLYLYKLLQYVIYTYISGLYSVCIGTYICAYVCMHSPSCTSINYCNMLHIHTYILIDCSLLKIFMFNVLISIGKKKKRMHIIYLDVGCHFGLNVVVLVGKVHSLHRSLLCLFLQLRLTLALEFLHLPGIDPQKILRLRIWDGVDCKEIHSFHFFIILLSYVYTV